ncbi:MAG: hypothetical protein ABSG81_06165 [Acidimicrobiales bacterium]
MQQREHTNGAIGASTFNDHDHPPERFTPGRVCAEPDCGAYLSIYNKSSYCSLHLKEVVRVRGRKGG